VRGNGRMVWAEACSSQRVALKVRPGFKSVAVVSLRIFGWMVTLVGCIVIVGALTGLYMLLIKDIPQGQPIFLDAVVPPLRGALLHLANGTALTCAPFILRRGYARWRRHSSGAWCGGLPTIGGGSREA